MHTGFSTHGLAPPQRRLAWQKAVSDICFPPDLAFHGTRLFGSSLDAWTLGAGSIS